MESTLMIKDLSINKELDGHAMSAVRGGSNYAIVGGNAQTVTSGGFASPATGVQVGPTVTQVDASTHTKTVNLNNILGQQFALVAQP